MTTTPISDTLKLAIANTVDQFTDQIRTKARDDHADELQHAGYSEAAAYLRKTR